MCSDCGSSPTLTLVCETPELAAAYATVLNGREGGTLINSQGEVKAATADGNVITIPWAGHPQYLGAISHAAVMFGVADMNEVKAMGIRAASGVIGIPEHVLRALAEGRSFEEATRPVEVAPADVDDVMNGLTRLLEGSGGTADGGDAKG